MPIRFRHLRSRRRHALLTGITLTLSLILFACVRTVSPPETISPRAAIDYSFETRVVAPKDDAEERPDGYVSRYSSDLELAVDGSNPQTIGLRFTEVTIPPEAIIVDAYLQFHVDERSSGAANLTIRGQATADALEFASSPRFDISTRPVTSTSASWEPPEWPSAHVEGPDQRTGNIAAVIQEIIDGPGWTSGNALALIITGSGERVAESYNGEAESAPLLHIDYQIDPDTTIDAFAASPATVSPGVEFSYTWSIFDLEGDPVSCELDVESDGTIDYAIPDCIASTSQGHAFSDLGTFVATLRATDSTGASDSATTSVDVSLGVLDILEVRVSADEDDAEESLVDGDVSRHSPDLEMIDDGFAQVIGMRFTDITVPHGATIANAYIQFQADEKDSEPTTLVFRGQADDDTLDFSSSNFSISTRPQTFASVSWDPPAWNVRGEAGLGQRTPNLATIIQEIVDRTGWVSGNAMTLFVTDESSGKRVAEAFDGEPNGAPLLHIEYTFDDSVSINSFDATPSTSNPNETVTFQWNVTDDDGDPVSCTLDYDNDGAVDKIVPDCIGTTSWQHVYTQPGTYQARLFALDDSPSAASDQAFFTVDVTTEDSVTIVAAGDISCDPTSSHYNGGLGTDTRCRQLHTSDLVLSLDPDAVFLLGDNQYEVATLSDFMTAYDPSWGRVKPITYPSVGNHEYLDPLANGYYTYFGAAAGDPSKGYYSFDIGTWHVVVLNTNCSKAGGCRAGSPQEQWLRQDLAASTANCTLAMWHHPTFSSGAIGGRDWSTDMWIALQDAGAEIILTGHDHNYERFAPQDALGVADPAGLRQFVVGTGGKNHTSLSTVAANSEVRRSGTFGVLKLNLHPTGYDWEFVPEFGENFTDVGSQSCQ